VNTIRKKQSWSFHVGLAALVLGIFLRYVACGRGNAGDFAEGLFLGMAVTLLIANAVRMHRHSRRV
jgi:hypothetical protein